MRISDWSSDVCSSDLCDELGNAAHLVGGQVVHDHDVAGCERRREELLDIGAEAFSGHRAVDHVGRIDPVMARPGHKGCGFPMALWNRDRKSDVSGTRVSVRVDPVGLRIMKTNICKCN